MAGYKRRLPDIWLFLTVSMLVGFGLIMVYSSSSVTAPQLGVDSSYFALNQVKWAIMGFAVMFVTALLPLDWFKKGAMPFYIFGLLLLAALYIPALAINRNGATRWLNLGFTTFMPSEAAKMAIVILLAKKFSEIQGNLRKLKDVAYCAVLILIPCVFILKQPDYSTMLIVIGTAAIMMFIAGLPWIYTILAGLSGGAGLVYLAVGEEYRLDRIKTFLDPWKDPSGHGWQVIQSLYAIASGKLVGLGYGQSRQKYGYLPEAMSDFIFAIVAEEMGLLGASILIMLFVAFLWRGYRISRKTDDLFAAFLAIGFTSMICLQAIVNMAVVTSSIPATGITLPFISAGGSSLVMSLIAVGMMLNASRAKPSAS